MKVKPGYKQTEIGIIPSDWEVIKLGDIFDFKNGLNKEKKYFGEGTPIVNYMDVYKNRGLLTKDILGKVTLTKQERKNYEVLKDDVLFTRTSETVEEIGISSVILENLVKTSFSGFVLRARPKNDKLDTHFKKYCFSTNAIRKEITSKSSYTTRALTNGRQLSEVRIPVPINKSEQTAIAQALSDTDELISSLDKLIVKKRNIKQGAMQQLLTGKKRLPGFTGEWETKKLGEVIDFRNGKAHENFISESGKYIVVNSKFISSEGAVIKYSDTYLCPTIIDDILMVMSDVPNGKAIAKCYLVEKNNLYTVNQRVCILRAIDVNVKFLYYKIDRHPYYLTFDDGVKQTNLRKDNVLNCEINLPKEKEEQTAIAQILSDMDSEIETLEMKRDKYKAIKQGMMQELLTGKTRLI